MTHVIILAGGEGKRMHASGPKALTHIGGEPMISRIITAVSPVCPKPTVVVGYEGDDVKRMLGDRCTYVFQKEQLGTGHAVRETQNDLDTPGISGIVVLYGDHPLISTQTVQDLIASFEKNHAAVTMATVIAPSYEGDWKIFEHFGRVVRDAGGSVARIVEWKDATEEERKVREVNPGYYCFDARWLWRNIASLENKNASGEYYLTDLISAAVRSGERINAITIADPVEGMGVNTPEELAIAERHIAT